MQRTTSSLANLALATILAMALTVILASPASAGSAPVTKLTFKISDHHVTVGETVVGSVTARTHSAAGWLPLAGVSLSLTVDKVEVATMVTDDAGHADIAFVATDAGGHVMRVVFAGDELHKVAHRAQGFEVVAAAA